MHDLPADDHRADDLPAHDHRADDLGAQTVVFFHAHPDDESIFTGGTIARLAAANVRTVVVIATSSPDGVRAAEASAACDLLGVDVLHLLGYGDAADDDGHGDVFHLAPTDEVAVRLAEILRAEIDGAGLDAAGPEGAGHDRAETDGAGVRPARTTTLVTYDDGGIYAHPDHLAVHRAGVAAAVLAGVEVVYEATVDREYLHFVETHLVGHAVDWLLGTDPGTDTRMATNRAPLGVPTVMVTTTVDVRDVAPVKRAAIAAHASQLPPSSDLHDMDDETFAAVYGYEWFVRRGPVGVLDRLALA